MEANIHSDSPTFDFIVIGAGIAGLSAAAGLARYGKTALVEMEAQPCHHSSGRSAAIFVAGYGNDAVRRLSAISKRMIDAAMPQAWGRKRGLIVVARKGGDAGVQEPGQVRISPEEAVALVPILEAGSLSHGWFEADATDMDVHAMHLDYLKQVRSNGQLFPNFGVASATHDQGLWQVSDGKLTVSAPVVVNASGAWLERTAVLFGAKPLGVVPKRRSAALADPPAGIDPASWPMVVDVEETVYFKPDAGKLMISPADTTPSEPCDCWPEDIDVAIGIDRFEHLTTHEVQRVSHMWAGLRSFVHDESPLIGPDPAVEGLFWLGALGGFGVQTAPATGAIAAAMAAGAALPPGADDWLIDAISPSRIVSQGGER